jgi:uncharacterized membrane protein
MYWDHMTGATTPTSPQRTEQANSARQVLDDRLARGDIDVEEYERRRTAMDRDFSASTRT